MYGNSKREKIDGLMRRLVEETIHELAFDHPEWADCLRKLNREFQIIAAYRISGDPYRLRELRDIVEWKKPPKG